MDNIFQFILNTVLILLGKFINIVTLPLLRILEHFIPNINFFINLAKDFLDNYIFNSIHFGKMLLVNILNINHTVFDFVVISVAIMAYIMFATLTIKLVYHAWRIFHGTENY